MSTAARRYDARVTGRRPLTPHLVRLTLSGLRPAQDDVEAQGDVDAPGDPQPFASTGVPDEWVGLIVPEQFQSRYYTVRSFAPDADGAGEMVLDVVVHSTGLVTEWAARADCVGDVVTVTEPKASFAPPDDAAWVMLVGDLTALPAIARILETLAATRPGLPVRVWVEAADDPALLAPLLPPGTEVAWSRPPADDASDLAAVVEAIDWPDGDGYFWMAGESAQMRAIRKHLMRERRLPSTAYDVMGYWRGGGQRRQPRAVDPGPIWRAGKAAGRSDDEIWADYDSARDRQEHR